MATRSLGSTKEAAERKRPRISLSTLAGEMKTYPMAAFGIVCLALAGIVHPFHPAASRVVLAVLAVAGGIPLVWSTLKEMIRGRFDVDTVAALAIVGSIGLGQFLAGALVVIMQSGGEALEDYGLRRANRSLDNLLRRAPSIAHRREGASYVDVPASSIQPGDILLVRPGDILAADGTVIDGLGNVDEAALTGEPIPLAKAAGDRVYSGTINLSGNFTVRATSTAAESKYELIVRMVQRAQGERAPINRLANRYTPAFTLLTVGIALLVFLTTRDAVRALAVLVVATPCPLIIATPLAVLSAVNTAAAMNVIVKSGAAIERAGEVEIVLFDKTGTLTSGQPSLGAVEMLAPRFSCNRIVSLAASVEIYSTHVLAEAVVRFARRHSIVFTPAAGVQEEPGTGIAGLVDGRRVVIGSAAYLAAKGVDVPESVRSERRRLGAGGHAVALVAVDADLAALLVFEDLVRPEAAAAVRRLEDMGIRRLVMLTGDAEDAALRVAAEVGIRDVRPQMGPSEKLAAIEEMRSEGTILMVGDGINDAPALSTAHIGVAMGGHGAGIATDAADVVVTVDDVGRVPDVIALGRRMLRVARQGILFGIGASIVLMILASLGFIQPAAGAFCQEAVDLAAILNALRAR